MANPASWATLTLPEYIKGISDNIVNDNVLLNMMKDKGTMQFNCGGDGFEFRMRTTRANIGGSVTDQDTGNAKTINPFKTGVAKYRPYLWRLFENALQQDRNNFAPDASKIADSEEEDLNTIMQEASERIGTHAYGDGSTLSTGDVTGSIPINGLESIIKTTGTYFGLSRVTNTALASQITACTNPSQWDDGLVNNLIKKLDANYMACCVGQTSDGAGVPKTLASKKEMPDQIITTLTLFNVLREALMPQHQYTADSANPIKKFVYAAAQVDWDNFCTAARVYVLNSKHMKAKVVGPQLLRIIKEIPSANPVGSIKVIGGQLELYSPNPRTLGAVQTTGT